MMARSTSVNFAGVFVSLPNATTRKREAGVGREARGKMTKTSAIKKTEAATNINIHLHIQYMYICRLLGFDH